MATFASPTDLHQVSDLSLWSNMINYDKVCTSPRVVRRALRFCTDCGGATHTPRLHVLWRCEAHAEAARPVACVPLRGTLVDTSQYPRLRSLRSLSQGLGIIQPLRGWVRRALRGYMSYQMSNQAVVPRRGTLMHNPSLSVAQTGGTRCTPSTCLGEVHTPQDI